MQLGSGNDFVETRDWSDIESGDGDDTLFATGVVFTGDGNDYVRFHVCDTCNDLSSFGGRLGPGDDSITIGDGIDSPVVGSPSVSEIDFAFSGGPGNDTLEDWFAVGADEPTYVHLGEGGSVLGAWTADLSSFENYLADKSTTGPRIFQVEGSDDPNIINVFGSDSFIYGFGGDDVLGDLAAGHIDGGDGDDTCTVFTGQTSCEN